MAVGTFLGHRVQYKSGDGVGRRKIRGGMDLRVTVTIDFDKWHNQEGFGK